MEPQRAQEDREEQQEPLNEENPVRPIDVDERNDHEAVSRTLRNELREAVARLRSEEQTQVQFEAQFYEHFYHQKNDAIRVIEEKLNSLDHHTDLELQSRGQRVLELNRREGEIERIMRIQENLNLREEEVNRREGDLTRREEDLIRRERDLIRREGVLLQNERVLITLNRTGGRGVNRN